MRATKEISKRLEMTCISPGWLSPAGITEALAIVWVLAQIRGTPLRSLLHLTMLWVKIIEEQFKAVENAAVE